MKNKDLKQLKKEYLETPIPEELDFLVKKAVKNNRVSKNRRGKFVSGIRVAAVSAAVFVALLAAGINTSPVFASALSKVPIIDGIVKVLTFREYTFNDDKYNADIKVPSIEGLENKALEKELNEKYLAENKKLYEQFMTDMEEVKALGDGHLGVDSGYIIKTDTDKILSIGRYVVNTVGSSSTTMKYDTIDKKNEILITLPSLFKDDSYIEVISENIKRQMIEQNKADDSRYFWVEGIEHDYNVEFFERISREQSFYIDSEGKLVISFDKYEVAPGYMGVVEFVIPSEVIADILVGNEYIE